MVHGYSKLFFQFQMVTLNKRIILETVFHAVEWFV